MTDDAQSAEFEHLDDAFEALEGISLADLNASTCRWPTGALDPRSAAFAYC